MEDSGWADADSADNIANTNADPTLPIVPPLPPSGTVYPLPIAPSLPTNPIGPNLDYKFMEPEVLKVIADYIDSTYDQHYVGKKNKIQTVEYIYDVLQSTHFMRANIIKYASRMDKKVGESAKKDLLKLIHYAVMVYYYEFMQDTNEDK